jgi:lipoprotein-anchoring transpeptidase ErfK/SrfK
MNRVTILLRSGVCALGLAFLAGLALLVVGCGGEATLKLSENSHQAARSGGLGARRLLEVPVSRPLANAPDRCTATATGAGSSSVAYAALVKNVAVIRKAPHSRSPVVDRLGRVDVNGFREVLGVIGVHSSSRCVPDWYRVQLSGPPNGLTGWVRSWAVRTFRVRSRIVVDLSQRRLRLYRSGRLALETAVTVGAATTPTPLGRYFVNERYVLPDASGPFGPNALGISAHSDVLQHVWVQDGPIGIHGTNEPGLIGQAASHGCIRLVNDVMRRLFPLAPAGTPVIVKA